jgi:hypothetical protein
MKALLIYILFRCKDLIGKILGDVIESSIYFLVECYYYYFGISIIIIGIILMKEKKLKKYHGYYSIISGILEIVIIYLLKDNKYWEIVKEHSSYYYCFIIWIQYFFISLIFNIYYFKEKYVLKKKISKEKKDMEIKTKAEKESILDKIREKNRQFSIIFVYSEKDEFLRLKKVRLQEIIRKNTGMVFKELNIDDKSDREFRENYKYSKYPFVVLLKENEILYKKEGIFKLSDIDNILKEINYKK